MSPTMASRLRLLFVFLAAWLVVAMATPAAHADEVQSWGDALNFGGRFVKMAISIQVIAMIAVLCLVGWVCPPIWRAILGLVFCLAVQVFKEPDLLKTPGQVLAQRWARFRAMPGGDQEMVANIGLICGVIFAFLLVFDLYLTLKPDSQDSTPSRAPAKEPTRSMSPLPPQPEQKKSIFDKT